MTAHAPAMNVAAVGHLLHAEPDLVDARDVPARMVARTVRFREGEHVVIAGVGAVEERDHVARAIRRSPSTSLEAH